MISPAAMIRLQQSDDESSRDTSDEGSNDYEVIKHPAAEKNDSGLLDDSDNENDSLYLSISRGRRKQLKLYRDVDWDSSQLCQERGKVFLPAAASANTSSSLVSKGAPWEKFDRHSPRLQNVLQKEESVADEVDRELHDHRRRGDLKTGIAEKRQHESSQERSKKLRLKKSLSKTFSSIVTSIRQLF